MGSSLTLVCSCTGLRVYEKSFCICGLLGVVEKYSLAGVGCLFVLGVSEKCPLVLQPRPHYIPTNVAFNTIPCFNHMHFSNNMCHCVCVFVHTYLIWGFTLDRVLLIMNT